MRMTPFLAVVLAAGALGSAGHAAEAGLVTRFPAAFFAAGQPYSAFDMVARLPGFAFVAGDNEVRGFAGSGGNVLVDGKRPTSKQEGLEAILRRIPARTVERIELIRGGAQGVDMQGQTVLANVVRVREAVTRGRMETALTQARGDLWAPRLAGEVSRRSGDRFLELSVQAARAYDPDKGEGPKLRFDPGGGLISAAVYREDQAVDTLEGAAGYERGLAGGALRLDASVRQERTGADITETRSFPSLSLETVAERETVTEMEVSGRFERVVAGGWKAEATGLRHQKGRRSMDVAREDGDIGSASVDGEASETIGRLVLRRTGAATSLELGGEAAINVLEARSRRTENGVSVPLPSAEVRVEERRAEASAAVTWQVSPRWNLEAGSRFEASRLAQAGDSRTEKSLSYLKPRVLVTWTPDSLNQVRLLAERRVGQLDFEDFVSSTSLTSNLTTAGNPNLAPDRTWRVAATWDRRVLKTGAVVITLRHDRIQDVVDRVPVVGPGFIYDAPGNLGDAVRTELEVNLNLPLSGTPIGRGLLDADLIWRTSRVTDPATGLKRPISGEPAVEGKVRFTQDLPAWRARWGLDLILAEATSRYQFDELRRDSAQARLGAFAEYRPAPAWNIRLAAENLGSGRSDRTRIAYDGLRGAGGLKRIETRRLDFGPSFALSVQREFAP